MHNFLCAGLLKQQCPTWALVIQICGGGKGNVNGTISNCLVKMPSFLVSHNCCCTGLWHCFLLWHVVHCCCTAVSSSVCCNDALPLHCKLLDWLFLVNARWLQRITLHHLCLPTLSYTVLDVLLLVVPAALVSITGCVVHPCLHNVVVAHRNVTVQSYWQQMRTIYSKVINETIPTDGPHHEWINGIVIAVALQNWGWY